MQIHNIKKIHPNHRKKRVGRGGKRGTFSGRGTKGQLARAGRKTRPELRDIIKKIPKLRGYRFNSFKADAIPVNLSVLEKHYANGEVVSPKTLAAKKIMRKNQMKYPVKILGAGSFSKKLTIEACAISASARAAVEKAGGEIRT